MTTKGNNMRSILISTFVVLLAGCATIGQKQATCESQFAEFADVVSCTKQATASDPRAKTHAGYKLYILKGEQLAQQVKDKQISDLDARVEWQKLYVELKNGDQQRSSQAARDYNANKPKTTTCVPVGNTVSCNTY
jgi:uncharacterized protein YceK